MGAHRDRSPVDVPEPPEFPASGVRHGVLAITTVMAVLLYLDRICISVAADPISREFGLTKEQMGLVLSAFFLSYGLAQLPAGWLGDRLGARIMLAASVLAWSLLTGLTGLVHSLAALVLIRLLFGFSQAAAYPVAARVLSQWMPFHRRGLASSILTLGGRGGGALAPALTAMLIVSLHGWRPVFFLYALLGLVWTIGFWVWFRDTPAEHRGCNGAEIAFIESSRPPEATDPNARAGLIPWGDMMRSPSLWYQCIMQFFGNIAWTFLITWAPTYLMEEFHLNLASAGLLASLPLAGGMVGCFLGGAATDALTRRIGLRWGRSLLGVAGKFLAAAGLAAGLGTRNPVVAVLGLTFASFTNDLGLAATWAYFQDAGGQYVGTFLGWANMFGNVGSCVCPTLLGILARKYGWPAAVGTCAGLFFVAGVFWIGIDARVPIRGTGPRRQTKVPGEV